MTELQTEGNNTFCEDDFRFELIKSTFRSMIIILPAHAFHVQKSWLSACEFRLVSNEITSPWVSIQIDDISVHFMPQIDIFHLLLYGTIETHNCNVDVFDSNHAPGSMVLKMFDVIVRVFVRGQILVSGRSEGFFTILPLSRVL